MNGVDRFLRGVGPEPRTFQVGRDYAPPAAALGESAVCLVHGTILRRGQPCPDCQPRKAGSR